MERLSSESLGTEIKNEGITIVEFGAGWCRFCAKLEGDMELFEKEHQDIKFVYVDADEFESVAVEYNVSVLPTILFFVDGNLVKSVHGYKRFKELEQILSEIKD